MISDYYKTKSEFYINMQLRDYEWSMSAFHYHDSYEIYYLVDGARKILVQDRIYEITPGDLVLVKPNVFHRSLNAGEHTRINIEFTGRFMDKYFTPLLKDRLLKCFESEFIHLESEDNAEIREFFETIQKEYREGGLFCTTFAELLKKLYCISEINDKNLAERKNELSKSSRKLQPIVTYINANYASIANVDEIAKSCYINKSYMCRLFKREMGITIIEYLNNIKIQQACEILKNTDDILTNISLKCGFSNTSYFSYQFKKAMDCTPSQFRKAKNRPQRRAD